MTLDSVFEKNCELAPKLYPEFIHPLTGNPFPEPWNPLMTVTWQHEDWRGHVPSFLAATWKDLSLEAKKCIFLCAQSCTFWRR